MYKRVEKMKKNCVIFEILNYIFLILSSIGCSTVSLAVTRLTVYWQLQVRIVGELVGSRDDYGPNRKIEAVFSKNLEKATYNNHFSDFPGLDLMFAEAHARGFAPLWALARGNRYPKVGRRTSKNDVKIKKKLKAKKMI